MNITPDEGIERLKNTFLTADLTETYFRKPDFYNAVWLNAALLFCFFVLGNVSVLLICGDFYVSYLFRALLYLFLSSFCYANLVWLIYVIAKLEKTNLSYMVIVGLYNYTNLFYALASFPAIAPIPILKWFVFGVAFVMSVKFLYTNLNSYCRLIEFENRTMYFVPVVILQALTFFMFKTGFFF